MAKYYVMINGQQEGPYSPEELRGKGVTSNTKVWAEGFPNWLDASQVDELKNVVLQIPPIDSVAQDGGDIGIFDAGPSGKSRGVAGLLAILIGTLGIHYFYIGKVGGGLICILLSIVTCGLWGVVTLIQGIMMLTMKSEEFERKYVNSTSTLPLF